MGALAQVGEHVDDIVGVVIEVEGACGQRHAAGIGPIGNINVMVREHGFHGVAQQRGIVAGHGGDDQQLGLAVDLLLAEMQESAEGHLPDHLFMDADGLALHVHFGDVEMRLAIAAGEALPEMQRGDSRPAENGLREGISAVFPEGGTRLQRRTPGCHGSVVHFIEMVEHDGPSMPATRPAPRDRPVFLNDAVQHI
ncbi:MAG: hypothetical protein U1E15_05840 [Hyphomicrobiales bacterium]